MDQANNKTEYHLQNINSTLDGVLPAYAFVLLACLFGNVVVCITILKKGALRQKRWYVLLINLSAADVGFALTTVSHILQLRNIDIGKNNAFIKNCYERMQ